MSRRNLPLVHIPPATRCYPLGTSLSRTGPPAAAGLRNTPPQPLLTFAADGGGLQIPSDGKRGFACVGDGDGRTRLVQTMLSKHLVHPPVPPPGMFPHITQLLSEYHQHQRILPSDQLAEIPQAIRHLQFARPSATGEFQDFTARYGSLHEADRVTLVTWLYSLVPTATHADVPLEDEERSAKPSGKPLEAIRNLSKVMGIDHLLELPVVALSSGQTRRARIVAGLLTRPRLLLLEDPFAGLDVQSRAEIGNLLGEVNDGTRRLDAEGEEEVWDGLMRIMLVLRGKTGLGMPPWITDVVEVKEGRVWVGPKEEYQERIRQETSYAIPSVRSDSVEPKTAANTVVSRATEPVVDIRDVSVAYGPKKVLDNVSWSVAPQSRWHLQGSNGSGKTTLLSLLLGHHPRSFSLPASSLSIFSTPRRQIPTPNLRKMIGHASPEIFAAFPRGMGLSAGEAIATGWEGVFSRRNVDLKKQERALRLLEPFQDLLISSVRQRPGADNSDRPDQAIRDIYNTDFGHFSPNHQALILFLRAIVARPKLLVLDEASQGMDEATWARCRKLLEQEWAEIAKEGGDQAVICVSHWEEEVPWEKGEGDVLRLHDGKVVTDTTKDALSI